MERFRPSERMLGVSMPPIAAVMSSMARMREQGRTVYGMAQAVPWFSPPQRALECVFGMRDDPRMHRYSPDPGYPEVRMAVADDFSRRRSLELDPFSELHLTCGASQAFLSALLTATSPGDAVAVVEPYYFDHLFAIRFSGLRPVSIPMEVWDGRWMTPVDELERIMPDVAALVLVNPGNPTGAVMDDASMRRITSAAVQSGTFIIIDETYERFSFTGDRWHPWLEDRPPGVLTIGSFSKSLGMPGWRIGYLFGESGMLEQAIKVQDSVVICPPTPGQLLLEAALHEEEWIEEMSAGVRMRRDMCRDALTGGDGDLGWMEADGAFFTLASYPGGMPSDRAAMMLLEKFGIASIPGSAFGQAGEGHLRISYGCLEDGEIAPAMELLGSVRFPRMD